EIVDNEELTLQKQLKAKEILLTEETLFVQNIENMGRTNVTTHSINTVLPIVRNEAVKRVEKAQESAKRKYNQNLLPIEEFKEEI
ncbi:27926_t:CDS:2, partial [Dentiscutata erythropus]